MKFIDTVKTLKPGYCLIKALQQNVKLNTRCYSDIIFLKSLRLIRMIYLKKVN